MSLLAALTICATTPENHNHQPQNKGVVGDFVRHAAEDIRYVAHEIKELITHPFGHHHHEQSQDALIDASEFPEEAISGLFVEEEAPANVPTTDDGVMEITDDSDSSDDEVVLVPTEAPVEALIAEAAAPVVTESNAAPLVDEAAPLPNVEAPVTALINEAAAPVVTESNAAPLVDEAAPLPNVEAPVTALINEAAAPVVTESNAAPLVDEAVSSTDATKEEGTNTEPKSEDTSAA